MSRRASAEAVVAQHSSACAALPDRKFVEALARGMLILQAFGRRSGPLSNSDLHELTRLPKPTLTRLTYTLTKLGYLRRTRSARFQLSPGVMALVRPLSEAVAARLPNRALSELASSGPWCVVVAEPAADALIVTAAFTNHQPGIPACMVGTRLDLVSTSAGHAFLASLPLDQQHMHNGMRTPIEVVAAARSQLHQEGYCFEAGTWRHGVATIALPIRAQGGSLTRVVMCAAKDDPALRARLVRVAAPTIQRLFASTHQAGERAASLPLQYCA